MKFGNGDELVLFVNDVLQDDEDEPQAPPVPDHVLFETESLHRDVALYAFASGDSRNGDDVMLGGAGNDSMHGGAGSDTMNGNGDKDRLYGGDDDDVMWGGSGHDHLYGGRGRDVLDIEPRLETTVRDEEEEDGGVAILPADSTAWFTYGAAGAWEGADFLFGGYDRNVMHSDQSGDRLLDWISNEQVLPHCGRDEEPTLFQMNGLGILDISCDLGDFEDDE